MKKQFITILVLILLSMYLHAQNTTVQIINNIADVNIGSISVDCNGNQSGNGLAFGNATKYFNVTPMSDYINIYITQNYKIMTQVFPTENLVYIFSGVEQPSEYNNPYNRNISLKYFNDYDFYLTSYGNKVAYCIYHGSTDAPKVNIKISGTNEYAAKDLDYNAWTGYPYLPDKEAKKYVFDVYSAVDNTLIASYNADLSNDANKTLLIILGGFMEPSKNKNGASLQLYGIYPDGSRVVFPKVASNKPSIPSLLSPENNSLDANTSGTLTWNKVNNSNKYKLQMSIQQDFSVCRYDLDNLTDTAFIYENCAGGKVFYWRIAAVNQYGESEWSPTWNFTIKKELQKPSEPVLVSPETNSTNIPKTGKIEWEAMQDVDNYTLQLSKNNAFTDLVINIDTITQNTFYYKDLEYNTKYYGRIKAENTAGSSDWSALFWFSIEDPSSVFLDTEEENDICSVIPNPIVGISKFSINISFDSNYILQIIDINGNIVNKIISSQKTIEINTNDYKTGIYFYKLLINNKEYIGKMQIIK